MTQTIKSRLRKFDKRIVINICLILFFVAVIIVPVIFMFSNMTADGFKAVFKSAQFGSAVTNSITTALVATIISLALAMLAAFCLERSGIKATSVFGIIFVIPMLIPSISHAFGIVSLFGRNGIITNLLHLDSNIYGFGGIVLGSVMYSFPVAFLMFSSVLQYEDGMPYKAATILGISKPRQFLAITLPYMKKTLISAFFAVFTMIITDYGVPLMIGGKTVTLSVLMYNSAVSNVNYNAGSVLGSLLLVPAIIAFVADIITKDNTVNSFVSESVSKSSNKAVKTVSYIYCALLTLFVVLPIIAFLVMAFETKYPVDSTFTFKHVIATMNKGAGEYLLNSIVYALLVALIGTVLSFVCAYVTSRMKGRFSKAVHLISMIAMAIPGIVLGLSYMLTFNSTAIYGTMLIIVMVNIVHFFSSPYLMMFNTLSKVNSNLEDVGQSLGISKIRIIANVIIPKVFITLLEMFVYFFVNSMMTISAVAFLAPPSAKPIALMINQFESQLLMECAAFVSLLIMLINVIMKGILAVVKWLNTRRLSQ